MATELVTTFLQSHLRRLLFILFAQQQNRYFLAVILGVALRQLPPSRGHGTTSCRRAVCGVVLCIVRANIRGNGISELVLATLFRFILRCTDRELQVEREAYWRAQLLPRLSL